MHLFTELMINEEFACPTSFMVCFSSCLIHWLRLQKGVHDIFDTIDLEKIQLYAACCEKIVSESGIVDVTACTYGSAIKYQIGGTLCVWLHYLKYQAWWFYSRFKNKAKSRISDATNGKDDEYVSRNCQFSLE